MKLKPFVQEYIPGNTTPCSADTLEKYKDKVPESLLELWKEHGFGKYGHGLIELVNPDGYQDILETWLGKSVPNYVPIAITAFSELFYYRKLTETDEDVCMIVTHYRNIDTCTWSLDDFFNDYLIDHGIILDVLRGKLFGEAYKKIGLLGPGDSYFFVPALALGGAEEIQYVDKGDARIHMDLLFQLTQ